MSLIKSPWPFYAEDEINLVTDILRSGKVNYWTGEQGKLFEKEYADYLGVPYTIAIANGTLALELGLHALGIGPGDEVIVPCRTFIASASCVVEVGAKPVVVDVDPISQNITVETIAPHVTPKTRAIIVVHLGGWPCDMTAIMAFAKEHGLFVIEDCAQAHGAEWQGKPIGSFGDVAAFSFCQDKIISTMGEGGLLATANKPVWEAAWAYKDHGKGYDTVYHKQHAAGFRWLHDKFGSNYRLTEAQAAVGRLQLKKLKNWILQRRKNASILNDQFKKLSALRVTLPPADVYHAYYRYYCFVKPNALKSEWTRDRIMQEINQAGASCFSGSCSEIYLEQAFQQTSLSPKNRLVIAKELGETSLAFLVHPTLGENEMYLTAQIASNIIEKASRDV